jgi:methyl-accepting chemotaxis protein
VIGRKNRRKLRNFIVNKKQLAIVVIGTVYFFLSLMAVLTLIVAPLYSDIFQSSEISVQRESAKVFILLSEKMAIAVSAIFMITIIPLIWGTHRFFGPLINFSNIFKRVTRGDLTARVHLRRGDLLKSEARLANEMIQSLRLTISELKQQNHRLITALNMLSDERRTRSRIGNSILEAQNQALACETLLEKFKTTESSDNGQILDDFPEVSGPKSCFS